MKEKAHVTSIDNKKISKINWVSEGLPARILLTDGTWVEGLVEPDAASLKPGKIIQFERFGFVRYDKNDNGTLQYWFSHN